jgi:hypothetical protein
MSVWVWNRSCSAAATAKLGGRSGGAARAGAQLAGHAPATVDLALPVIAIGAAIVAMGQVRVPKLQRSMTAPQRQPQRRLRLLSLNEGGAQAPVQKRTI